MLQFSEILAKVDNCQFKTTLVSKISLQYMNTLFYKDFLFSILFYIVTYSDGNMIFQPEVLHATLKAAAAINANKNTPRLSLFTCGVTEIDILINFMEKCFAWTVFFLGFELF